MKTYRLSRRAEADLLHIAEFSAERWGVVRGNEYLSDLESCMEMLARNPALGRACDSVRPKLRRFEKGSHVIFFRESRGGIAVSRVLHSRMLPERYTP